jgi:hypothetical protein
LAAAPTVRADITFPVFIHSADPDDPEPILIGQIVLHSDTTSNGGKGGVGLGGPDMSPSGFQSLTGDGTLQAAATASGETGFNWVSIVTAEPPSDVPIWGPVPHIDPAPLRSGLPNPDFYGDPWYLNPAAGEVPPLTDSILEFSDTPTVAGGNVKSFATYLVSFFDNGTYDVLTGFNWIDTGVAGGPNTVAFSEIDGFPQTYKDLVYDYNGRHWRYGGPSPAPEPEAWSLTLIGFGVLGWRMRSRRSTTSGAAA